MCIIINTPKELTNDTYWQCVKNYDYKNFNEHVKLIIYDNVFLNEEEKKNIYLI